jgi:hypothetical protein
VTAGGRGARPRADDGRAPAPVYVTFRHMAPRASLEEYAREQAGRLERFFPRIVDCRVQLEPNDAGVLRVRVELAVPGERLVASYESDPDGAAGDGRVRLPPAEHRWLHALHEAFEAAGRILQDHAGRQRDRSRHPGPAVGT